MYTVYSQTWIVLSGPPLTGLLIFRVVKKLRNSGKSAKSHKIHAKFALNRPFFANCFLVKFALKTPVKFRRNRPINFSVNLSLKIP